MKYGIKKWEPLKDLMDIQDIFDKFFPTGRELSRGLSIVGYKSPAVELIDKNDKFIVRAELPGINKKDIKITAEIDSLTLEAEVKKEEDMNDKGYCYSERSYGSYYRTISLPSEISKDKAKASYKDGILEIELPKAKNKTEKKKVIEID